MKISAFVLISLLITAGASAQTLTFDVHSVSAKGLGKKLGSVTVEDGPFGAVLTPKIDGLSPGLHGFHVHQNPSCQPGKKKGVTKAAIAAGGHFDPGKTGTHTGPYGKGHLGDLPLLYVDAQGRARVPVLAPRIKVADFKGRAVMIHAGGDNYADTPKSLGGGGARMACGVVK